MVKVTVFGDSGDRVDELTRRLSRGGFQAVGEVVDGGVSRPADLGQIVLVDIGQPRLAEKVAELAKAADIPAAAVFPAGGEMGPEIVVLFDDFLVEPFSEAELWLRVKRLAAAGIEARPIVVDGLVIHPDTYEVLLDGSPLQLTYKEYELLRFLVAHPERVWDRQTLLNQIWEYDYYGGARTVDVHVRRLRAKLGPRYGNLIQTVRQVGYRFVKPFD